MTNNRFLIFLFLLGSFWFWLSVSSFSTHNAFLITEKAHSVDFPIIDHNLTKGENFLVNFSLHKDFWASPNFKIASNACFMEVFVNGESILTSSIEKCHSQIDIALPRYENKVELKMQQLEDFAYISINSIEDNFIRNNAFLIIFALLLYLWKFKNTNHKLIKLFLFILFGNILFEFFTMLKLGLYHSQHWDIFIYSAVGKGILNGILPYTGLFETKPPGMFFLTLLSHYLTDGLLLFHLFWIFALSVIVSIPIIAYFWFAPNRSIYLLYVTCFVSLLLGLYTIDHAGGAQTESFGAAFGCIAVLAFANPNFDRNKKLCFGLIVIGLLGSCGFKEPFLFSLLGSSLLFIDNLKDFIRKFILPLCVALVIGFIILLITGILDGFISYLQYMGSAHINRYGSPYQRGAQIFMLIISLNNYAWGLGYLFAGLLFSPFLFCKENLITKAFLFLSGLLLTSFAVCLSGEYWVHHFIFATPFYVALWLYFLRNSTTLKYSQPIYVLILIILVISALNIKKYDWQSKIDFINRSDKASELDANYIDSVLNRENLDRYLYLDSIVKFGIYGYTKHSPQGPYFFQDPKFVRDIPHLKDTMLVQLKNAQIVVDGTVSHWPEPWKSKAEEYLQQNFTLEPWDSVKDIYRPARKNKIYFRKRLF
jgi:hypothetical protein